MELTITSHWLATIIMKKMLSLPLTPEKVEYLLAYLQANTRRLEIGALIREKCTRIQEEHKHLDKNLTEVESITKELKKLAREKF